MIFDKFDSVLGLLIVFLRAAAKINNKDALKVGMKITKITDPNFYFFFIGEGEEREI